MYLKAKSIFIFDSPFAVSSKANILLLYDLMTILFNLNGVKMSKEICLGDILIHQLWRVGKYFKKVPVIYCK